MLYFRTLRHALRFLAPTKEVIPPVSPVPAVKHRQDTFISYQGQRMLKLEKYKAQWIPHLILREGKVLDVYLDSLGKPTVGVGHLIVPSDGLQVGDTITDDQCLEFLDKDSEEAWSAACFQSELTERVDQEYITGLASVNFQLGTKWYKIHKRTWSYLLAGKWELAAMEVEDSQWYDQTPVRVRDFQEALLSIVSK